jgi:hypothetical protein
MATKILLVTLRVEVADLPEAERVEIAEELARQTGTSLPHDHLPTIEDVTPRQLGLIVADALPSEGVGECLWPGTDTFVRFTGADMLSAEWG